MLGEILKQERIDPKQFELDLSEVLKSPHGRVVLWVILTKSGYFNQEYMNTTTDLAANAGRRDVGQLIMELLDMPDADYLALLREESEARKYLPNDKEESDLYDPPSEDE